MAAKNFAISTVATAPSPATSGTSLVVAAGEGARLPTVPFQATIWPAGGTPTPLTAEVVTVTAVSTDTLTITRAQESSTARTVVAGDLIAATLTAGMWAAPAFVGPVTINGALTNPAATGLLNNAPTVTTNVDASIGLNNAPIVIPSAPLTNLYGLLSIPMLDGTEGVTTPTIGTVSGLFASVNTTASYDANITSAIAVIAGAPTHNGGGTIGTLYGFYSGINSGVARITTAWAFYGAGTAPSFLNGALGLGADPGAAGRLVVGGTATNPTSGVVVVNTGVSAGAASDGMATLTMSPTVTPTAALGNLYGVQSWTLLNGTEGVTTFTLGTHRQINAAFNTLSGYDAAITNVMMYAFGGIGHAGGGTITNLYGYYGDISPTTRVTNAWQLYLTGTAPSFINGKLGIGGAPGATGQLILTGAVTDPTAGVLAINTAVSAGAASDGMAVISASSTVTPTAALGTLFGLQQWTLLNGTDGVTTVTIGTLNNVASSLNTLSGYDAAITTINMFSAGTPALGGAGTITNVYGYYCGINAPLTGVTNPWQLYMGGSAPSAFLGKVSIGIGVVQTANYLYVNRTSTGADGIVSMAAFELTTTAASGATDQGATIAVMRMQDTARGAVRAGEYELLRWDDTGTGTATVIEAGIHNHRALVSHADNPATNDNFYGTGGIMMYNVTSGEIGSGTIQKANFGLLIRNLTGGIKHPLLVYGPSDRKILDLDDAGNLMVDHVDTVHGQIRHYEVVTTAAATLQTLLGPARTVTSAVAATNQKNARGEWLRLSATASNADANLVPAAFTLTQVQADPIFITRVEIPTAKVNMRVFIGLFSAAPVLTTDTQNTIHSAYFRFSTGASDTTWQCCTSNATSTTVATLLYAPTLTVDTVYLLKIDATDAANIRFYINGTLAAIATATLPTATQNLGIAHYLRSLSSTVQKDLDVGWTGVYQ